MSQRSTVQENISKEFGKEAIFQDGGLLFESTVYSLNISEGNFSKQSHPLDYYPVEQSNFTECICIFLLLVGFFGNLLGILVFRCQPSGRKPLVIDVILTYLCITGITTTVITAPMHIYASKSRMFPADSLLCQAQGLLLNLLCLVSLWYTAVMSTERIVSPHEHRLTFSPLNLNVILAGVFVLLVVEVSGPIYGWAEYGFVNDSAVCLLNPESNHIFTYSMIYVACYVIVPVLSTLIFSCYVIRCGLRGNEKLNNGSQVLKTGRGIIVLCIGNLITTLCLLPYQAILVLQALLIPLSIQQKVIIYWLHIIGITCVYPLVLITFGRREVFPALKALSEDLFRCDVMKNLFHRQRSKTPESESI